MRSLLLNILHALVQVPEALNITQIDGEQSVYFEIRCAPEDVGIVIGKNGKTISAIRVLLNALSGHDDLRTVVEVIEPVN
jgi:predicted RNA-binding protein YlqC (UPF0109 family)